MSNLKFLASPIPEIWRGPKSQQDAQLSQTDHTARCISFGQKWKTGTGRQYFTDVI